MGRQRQVKARVVRKRDGDDQLQSSVVGVTPLDMQDVVDLHPPFDGREESEARPADAQGMLRGEQGKLSPVALLPADEELLGRVPPLRDLSQQVPPNCLPGGWCQCWYARECSMPRIKQNS